VSRTGRRVLLGAPLSASAVAVERMRRLVAMPGLSADALSSVAYGPEVMLMLLVLAGAAGLGYSLPIAGAMAFLMLAAGVRPLATRTQSSFVARHRKGLSDGSMLTDRTHASAVCGQQQALMQP
jgi:hypothetical protein